MGNIATPNTSYCLGFQQASLSVGNKTFSTQHPPISYSIDGNTVTVFDALGVIGITPYSSDDFVEISSSPASPNTNYCSSAKAVLSWSSGTIETLNTPISYQLRSNIVEWGSSGVVQGIYNAPSEVNSASIQNNANKLLINGQIETFSKPVASWQPIPQSKLRIDWGGGDISYLDGQSATVSQSSNDIQVATLIHRYNVNVNRPACEPPNFPDLTIQDMPLWNASGISNSGGIKFMLAGYSFKIIRVGQSIWTHCASPGQSVNITRPYIHRCYFGEITSPSYSGTWAATGLFYLRQTTTVTSNTGAISERLGYLNPQITTVPSSCILRVTFTDGTTQDLSYPTCPTVQNIPGCTVAIIFANSTAENILVDPCPDFVNVINNEVTVFDDTGQIFKTDFSTSPLNFQVTCYDFNVTEVSYVCQGDCPSGTEFRCVCPATNTIMCYGFDPDNPNVFRPLFTTQITS